MIQKTLNEISNEAVVSVPPPQPEFIIDQNTQEIMDDIETGDAFDRSILNKLGEAIDEFPALAAQSDSLFGSFSPVKGLLDGLTDSSPLSLEDIEELGIKGSDDQPLPLSQLEGLLDRPKGALLAMSQQVENQFRELSDNISLYASNQRVMNAMGKDTGCNSLAKQFGTIAEFGQQVSLAITDVQAAVSELTRLKTQIQSEIDTFDQNVINILTGRVSGTILSEVVRGTGLLDQLDNIFIEAGIAKDSAEAQDIRSQVAQFLDPTLEGFFSQKTITNESVKRINDQSKGVFGQINEELRQVDGALTTLRKLGAANSLSGLFAANECVQTLMGFVATTPFLNKLGRGVSI